MQEKPKEEPKKLFLISSGILLSVIFIILGYIINFSVVRTQPTIQQDYLANIFILMFLSLSSGYNIAMSMKSGIKAYYFYSGLFSPIFLLALIGSIMRLDFIPVLLMGVSLAFPIIYSESGIIEQHEKFIKFINLFCKYLPNTALFTFAIGNYGSLLIGLEAGVGEYIVSFIASVVIVIGLKYYGE